MVVVGLNAESNAKVAEYNYDQLQVANSAKKPASGSIVDSIFPMAPTEMQIDHEILESNIFNTSTVILEIQVLRSSTWRRDLPLAPRSCACLNAACNVVGNFTLDWLTHTRPVTSSLSPSYWLRRPIRAIVSPDLARFLRECRWKNISHCVN